MKAKELKIKHCPLGCKNSTLTLTKKKMTLVKGIKVVKGVFDVWTCSKCGEGFTHHWKIKSAEK